MQHELNLTIWSINTDRADEVRSIIIECHYIGVIADKRVSQVACGAESLKFASTTEPSNVESVIARQVEAQASSRSSRPAGSSATSKQTPTSLDPPPLPSNSVPPTPGFPAHTGRLLSLAGLSH